MTTLTKGISMFLLSALIMALLVMIVLGFMLGFTHPLPWILIGVLAIIPYIHDKIVSNRFVQWNDSLSVGIDSIDADHKRLLGMINQLQTAAHYHTDDEMIEKTLNELMAYTQYHFTREEEIMQANGYPDFDEHKQQHQNMVNEVSKFIDEYRVNKTRTIDNVTLFLKTWLINHIKGSDQEYAPYLKDKGIK
ncbi:MAG: bacteriohemerythrin [Gammaproteobacteria bacterium]